MSQESTGIHWLLSDTNFILSSYLQMALYMKSPLLMTWMKRKMQTERIFGCLFG